MLKLSVTLFMSFLILSTGCKSKSVRKKLIDQQLTFWNVLSKDRSYIEGSYLFNENGSCAFYTYKRGKRSELFDEDVVYPHTWKLTGDTLINILGFDRLILKITDDSLYLKNIQSGDTIILIKSKDL